MFTTFDDQINERCAYKGNTVATVVVVAFVVHWHTRQRASEENCFPVQRTRRERWWR